MHCLLKLGILQALLTALTVTACKPEDKSCEFWLVVERVMTMVNFRGLLKGHKGQLYYATDDPNNATAVPVDGIITADGYIENRMVYVVNGTFPGPDIVVHEGQDVIVHVKNKLDAEPLTVHWHGIHQKGTPTSDGVDMLTQWPILPHNTFTYRFKADPPGTHWYHSHTEFQISMGVQGGLIVKRKKENHKSDTELSMFITDWNNLHTTRELFARWKFGYYDASGHSLRAPAGLDGFTYGRVQMHSGLINGRGRYVDPKTKKNNGAPLSRFTVKSGDIVRIRLVNSAAMFPFRFAIESHTLTVISSDGADMQGIKVDALLIYPGETYDVLIKADQKSANYKIVAKTVLVESNILAEGILHYSDAADSFDIKDGDILKCSQEKPCTFFNCPAQDVYIFEPNSKCINIDAAQSVGSESYKIAPGEKVREIFLNFAYPRPARGGPVASVNAINFHAPASPVLLTNEVDHPCPADCAANLCTCTQTVELQKGEVIQMVLLNAGAGAATVHSIHLHGHCFQVLKMGYGVRDPKTGALISTNTDVFCASSDRNCANATWANGKFAADSNANPMLKDTILVPSGGYVVTRFRADNPGMWIMHCHQELHLADGMAMVFVEAKEDIPDIPDDTPYMGRYKEFGRSSSAIIQAIKNFWSKNIRLLHQKIGKLTNW